MRIRKNAKLCGGAAGSVLFGLGDNFQTHVCRLNQSPWDVIPFGLDSPLQFDGEEDSFTGNGSRGDSVGAVESVASMMDAEDQTKPLPKIEDTVVVHDNEAKVLDDIDEGRTVDETTSFCQKSDGKNWHCRNEAKQGQSFCDHHLSLFRSYNSNNSFSYNSNNTSSSKKAAASAAGVRRGKARAAVKRASSSSSSSSATSNPNEFYYYSGFGPLWGKRRGDRIGEGSKNQRSSSRKNEAPKGVDNSTITEEGEEANEETSQNTTSPSPSPSRSSSSSQRMDDEEFDYGVEDEEEDEEEANDGDKSGKKRMRKPVKARSLKSLM